LLLCCRRKLGVQKAFAIELSTEFVLFRTHQSLGGFELGLPLGRTSHADQYLTFQVVNVGAGRVQTRRRLQRSLRRRSVTQRLLIGDKVVGQLRRV